MNCFECGNPAECDHHVVPKILGGTKTVPLCLACHGKIHGKDFVKLRRLQGIGIAAAKARGAYKGREPGARKASPQRAKDLRAQGLQVREIAAALGVSERTAARYLTQ